MSPDQPHDDSYYRRTLKAAVGDARLLAFLFVLLGLLFAAAGMGTANTWDGRVLGAVAGVLFIGPGVLYFVSARLLDRAKPAGAAMARGAAAAHVGGTAILFLLAVSGVGDSTIVPAVMGGFFIPALVAFLAQTGRAMRAATMLEEPGPAFQPVIPKPVLPVEEAVGRAPDADTAARRGE